MRARLAMLRPLQAVRFRVGLRPRNERHVAPESQLGHPATQADLGRAAYAVSQPRDRSSSYVGKSLRERPS